MFGSSVNPAFNRSSEVKLRKICGVLVLTLMISLATLTSAASLFAQESIGGFAVRDITEVAGCSLSRTKYAGMTPDSGIAEEWAEACPLGSVLEVTPVGSAAEAESMGAIFLPSTGDEGR